jgi:3'-phosphoadenosine 5'-phosphosulfate sulfotransferase (PAPS reductase)/FAD synthetase
MKMQIPAEISNLVDAGALFVANHSGGKDSQAMLIKLAAIIPARQLIVVHASLGEVEWPGALELAQDQAKAAGLTFIVARPVTGFLEMVERRFETRPDAPSWPSPKYRQCTSDLKRGPIEREIRRYAKANGFTKVVNCTGLRAAESPNRAKLSVLAANSRNTTAGREWLEWLPIHNLTTAEVFSIIAGAGQQPHAAYAAGNERLSCVFCIMGSKGDLQRGARANPDLFRRYVELEQRTGYTMHASQVALKTLVEG